jgi:large repetitive protein
MHFRCVVPGGLIGGVVAILKLSHYAASTEAVRNCVTLCWRHATIRARVLCFPRLIDNCVSIAARIFDVVDRDFYRPDFTNCRGAVWCPSTAAKSSCTRRGKPVLCPVISSLPLNYGEKSTLLTTGSNPASQSSSISTLAPGLVAGSHQLAANYPGDNSFGASQVSYSFSVAKAESLFQDFFPVGSLVANAPVKLDGQIGLVNGGFAAYGGTVTITDITDPTPVLLGVGQVDSNVYGSFPVVVTFKTTGTRLIKAEYSGDANVNPTTSTYHMPIPSSSSSYVSVGSDTTSAIAGSAVTLTATIGSDIRLYPATGTATFLNGATTLGTAPVVSTYLVPGDPTSIAYVATLVTKALPPGANNISANYSGDSALQASSGGPTIVMIADYTMQAQPSTLTIAPGQSGTLTLNILPIGGSTQTV